MSKTDIKVPNTLVKEAMARANPYIPQMAPKSSSRRDGSFSVRSYSPNYVFNGAWNYEAREASQVKFGMIDAVHLADPADPTSTDAYVEAIVAFHENDEYVLSPECVIECADMVSDHFVEATMALFAEPENRGKDAVEGVFIITHIASKSAHFEAQAIKKLIECAAKKWNHIECFAVVLRPTNGYVEEVSEISGISVVDVAGIIEEVRADALSNAEIPSHVHRLRPQSNGPDGVMMAMGRLYSGEDISSIAEHPQPDASNPATLFAAANRTKVTGAALTEYIRSNTDPFAGPEEAIKNAYRVAINHLPPQPDFFDDNLKQVSVSEDHPSMDVTITGLSLYSRIQAFEGALKSAGKTSELLMRLRTLVPLESVMDVAGKASITSDIDTRVHSFGPDFAEQLEKLYIKKSKAIGHI